MTVRIGLLGSGFVSNFYLLGLQGVSNWEIPVVASPSADHAASFAKKWNIAESTSDVAGVIARADLDLIVLGVPNHFHKDLVIECTRAGKHVVCTKPLGRNRHEARAMLDAVEAAGVLHGYAETEVFSPAVMKARDYIERGGIGRVLTVRSREAHSGPHAAWFWKKELAGGGALLDMGCHTIEAARYFIGKEHKIVEVLAWTDRLCHHDATDAEDNAVLLLRFDSGALAHLELSWTARGGLDLRNEVYGSEGAIFTDVTRETSVKVFSRPGAGYTVEKAEGETGWLFPPVDEAWVYGYREEMRHFIECVRQGRMPRETFADGYLVNCVLDAAYRSAETKRWEPVDYSSDTSDDRWETVKRDMPIGTRVRSRVKVHRPFGVFTTIADVPFDGLIQITDFDDVGRMTPADYPPVGTELEAVVLGFKERGKQIWLGVRPSQLAKIVDSGQQ